MSCYIEKIDFYVNLNYPGTIKIRGKGEPGKVPPVGFGMRVN